MTIETLRFWADSKPRLRVIADQIARLDVGPKRVAEIIIRPMRKEKTTSQRALLHTLLAEFANGHGITPGQAKSWFKEDFYGVDSREIEFVDADGEIHKVLIKTTRSTEDEDREGYTRLIDYLYQWAAEKGVVLGEARPPKHLSNRRSE